MQGLRIVPVLHGSSIATLVAVGAFAFILLLFVFASIFAAGAPLPAVAFILVFGLLLGLIIIHELVVHRRFERLYSRAVELIAGFDGSVLRFSRSVAARRVLIASSGWWVSTGRSRSYRFEARVEPLGEVTVGDSFRVGGSWGVVVDKDGSGAVVLEGVLLEEPGLDGVVIAVVPAVPPVFRYTRLDAVDEGDAGFLEVASGEGLRGRLVLVSRSRARGARAELLASLEGRSARLVLCRVHGTGEARFEERLAPGEHLVVVSIPRRFSPMAFAEATGLRVGGVLPAYRVRLVLDIPFARDIVVERELQASAASRA
ncbi:hypothetical protein [Pyrolobus fumarii]|uniref:hypothetical protein n=1 Tax=Pyrolobus fumarii TaxID=54252 RepID=UPI00064F8386|nr:hypothetical protein [Pyrolobus fumarii]